MKPVYPADLLSGGWELAGLERQPGGDQKHRRDDI